MISASQRRNYGYIIFVIISIFLLNGCDKKGCIPADTVGNDFIVTIPAKPDEKDYKSNKGEHGGGVTKVSQTVRWIDTGFLANGEDIIAKVNGEYSAWLGLDKDRALKEQDLPPERICTPIDGNDNLGDFYQVGYNQPRDLIRNTPPDTQHYKKAKEYHDEIIGRNKGKDQEERAKRDLSLAIGNKYGMPCWNIHGYGVYILLADPDNSDNPNETLYKIDNPTHPVAHMYYGLDNGGFGQFDSSKTKFYDNQGAVQTIKKRSRIYLKIKDSYYNDNVGEMEVRFQHGVMAESDKFRLFDFISRKIRTTLEYITQKLFMQIVKEPGYRSFILACLTLYVTFTALSYLLGLAQVNAGDILMRLIKMAIIVMFISPNAWDFFTKHLLNFYLHGIDEIIGMVGSHANPQGSYDPESPFNFLDRFFISFFSEDVWIKIGSMFAIDIVALAWVLLMMLMILMFLYVCAYALLIYLTSVTVIAIVIIVMPFIFVTMLFPIMKPMIDGWFSILLSYSLQAIMMFLLVSMFIALLTVELYKSIGFPACNNLIARISIFGGVIYKPESFTPGNDYATWNWDVIPFFDVAQAGIKGEEVDGTTGTSFFANWVVGGGQYNNKMITVHSNKSTIRVPPYYDRDREEERYIHLPFLDPNNKSDAERLKNIFNKGQILDLGGTAVAVLICYTMVVLRKSILEIAQHLSGASMLSGLAGDAKWAGSLSSMPGHLWTQYVGDKIAKAAHLDKIHHYTARITSPISGGKTVTGISNQMVKDHKAYKHINMLRDGSGVILSTIRKGASAPNEVLPKALDMFDLGLMSSHNVKTEKFTDHFDDLKPSNVKQSLGDKLKYMYSDERSDKMFDKTIMQRKMEIFEEIANDPEAIKMQKEIDDKIAEDVRDKAAKDSQESIAALADILGGDAGDDLTDDKLREGSVDSVQSDLLGQDDLDTAVDDPNNEKKEQAQPDPLGQDNPDKDVADDATRNQSSPEQTNAAEEGVKQIEDEERTTQKQKEIEKANRDSKDAGGNANGEEEGGDGRRGSGAE